MKPIGFKQATKELQRPSTMPGSDCRPLPVYCDGNQCVSCWRPSLPERVRILFGGKVWLGVLSGKTQPPVYVTGESVFVKTPLKSQIKAAIVYVCERIIAFFDGIRQRMCNE